MATVNLEKTVQTVYKIAGDAMTPSTVEMVNVISTLNHVRNVQPIAENVRMLRIPAATDSVIEMLERDVGHVPRIADHVIYLAGMAHVPPKTVRTVPPVRTTAASVLHPRLHRLPRCVEMVPVIRMKPVTRAPMIAGRV